MQIQHLQVQVQCQLSDGSMVTIVTQPLVPKDNVTLDDVRSTIMGLGEDAVSKMKKGSSILQASGFSGLRLHPDD